MAGRLRIPGGRDVRATLDEPGDGSETVVVACPPHPQMGGSRTDARLRAVSDALTEQGLACLRIDYGPWDRGEGERVDARRALAWAHDDYDRVGLFGYSFGGAIALVAAAAASRDDEDPPGAVSVLAPAGHLEAGGDPVAALSDIDCPVQVMYGERDDTADSLPVADRARETGAQVESLPADHFFVGQTAQIGDTVADFFAASL